MTPNFARLPYDIAYDFFEQISCQNAIPKTPVARFILITFVNGLSDNLVPVFEKLERVFTLVEFSYSSLRDHAVPKVGEHLKAFLRKHLTGPFSKHLDCNLEEDLGIDEESVQFCSSDLFEKLHGRSALSA
ncbi:hypothetical protein L596_016723 [Steinernema carpocapsae]|uniref:Uncharacterized protein n=1 Tax=Steinernema carpocapsae TaxID=34508 RepID=A0A4U5NK67_STECR|nr:hypothetical protein L596_016723 [Steinernema carpocapsae]